MCGICGCSDHHHKASPASSQWIEAEENLLAKNDADAEQNRAYLAKHRLKALNIMSSPGSGKTTLLSRTVRDLQKQMPMAVIVGDQATDADATALREAGAQSIQINTGKSCHLDAHRVGHALEDLQAAPGSLIFVENIGNLVCPALFDLGEDAEVVILSVTEGDNKPLKYPQMFRKARLLLITKMDLLPYVDFNMTECLRYLKKINPKTAVIQLSAKTGEGLDEWYQWLKNLS